MSNENPYQPPQAELSTESSYDSPQLAGRGQRFGAALIDGLIGGAMAIPIILILGTWNYIKAGSQPPLSLTLLSGVLGFAAFILVHGHFLNAYGQTVGKRLVGIRIVKLNGDLPGFQTLIVARYLPITLVSMIPFAGGLFSLVDILFIFRQDRRCVHDLIAGTRVETC